EKLLAVGAPSRFPAPTGGYLPLAASCGKRGDVDLISPRLVGHISHPLPVRRKRGIVLLRRGSQEGEGLALAEQRQNPDVGTGVARDGQPRVRDVAAISRPGRGRVVRRF